jgi:hypothetical protein
VGQPSELFIYPRNTRASRLARYLFAHVGGSIYSDRWLAPMRLALCPATDLLWALHLLEKQPKDQMPNIHVRPLPDDCLSLRAWYVDVAVTECRPVAEKK